MWTNFLDPPLPCTFLSNLITTYVPVSLNFENTYALPQTLSLTSKIFVAKCQHHHITMSDTAPGGGVSFNRNPSSSDNSSSNTTQPSLLRPSRAVYPALPGHPDPDDLIQDIPSPEKAVSEFQSVPFAHVTKITNPPRIPTDHLVQPPQRDVPSIIIAHISKPQTSNAEPDWIPLMNYFQGNRCLDGTGNLQDLNTTNSGPHQICLHDAPHPPQRHHPQPPPPPRTLHGEADPLAQPALPASSLPSATAPLADLFPRYDYWHTQASTYTPLAAEAFEPVPSRPTRSVLRSVPTPSGQNLLHWLSLALNTPPHKQPCPDQLVHRPCHLDAYLDEDEGLVRRMRPEALLQRTAKVLSLFWWVAAQNAWLEMYEGTGWAWIEKECYA
ncbi:hypothetical protein PMIN01_00888 [Paraphaeosphaeria minitans]|uniref:Uncharacterized protein n=1 Tax=Paraphaeosphaeria minitans TaxID=565426 RepID=A0A9P6GW91_9PLEO|nr:hypothetical protein PMIN01_00888 [Paraphaeosphaeria minitans]